MTKTIEKIMHNGVAYEVGFNSKITIKKNGTKVDDFTLNQSTDKDIDISVPTNSDYVDLTSAQSVGGVKTFTSEPVLPSKTADATNTGTKPATEAQVYKKQDSLTLPSTPTSGHLVVWGANNKTLADGGAVPPTYNEVSKSDMDTGTSTTAGVVSAKSIADYVSGRVGSAVQYKGQVNDYDSLPSSPSTGDMYNVVEAHTTSPVFAAGTNVVWNGTAWDPLAGPIDLSGLVDTTTNQTIGGTKTFSVEPVLPSKDTAVGTSKTSPATEYQVKAVKDSIKDSTISITQGGDSIDSFSVNQSSAKTIALRGDVYVTQSAYNNLPSSKTTDGNSYIIYSDDAA